MNQRFRDALAGYLFLAPFLLTLGVFFIYAFVRAVVFSFTNYNLFNINNLEFIGLQNYINLFQSDNFLRALFNTVVFATVVTALQTVGALLMAAVLNQKVRGLGFFRAAFYMPSVTSSVVITLIFLWLFQRTGLINYLITQFLTYLPLIAVFTAILVVVQLAQVGVERARNLPAGWLDPALLVISILVALAGTFLLTISGVIAPREVAPIGFIWLNTQQSVGPIGLPLIVIMFQNIFTTMPTFMLMFLAALQDVPKSYYEAASLDGATALQQFLYITVPSVQPVTFLVVTLGLIGTLQMFDQVAIFGDAAPLESIITLAYFVYNRMFPGGQLPEVGFASAAAMFLAVLTLIVVLIQRIFIPSERR